MLITMNGLLKQDLTYYFLEKIDVNFFNELSKDKVNSRCRCYHGPKIKIKNGFSLNQSNIRKKDSILCEEEKFITPDDQFYIFHQKIAKRTFKILTLESLKTYVDKIKIEKSKWVHSWIRGAIVENYEKFYNEKMNGKRPDQGESFHQFLWNSRGVFSNVIGIKLRLVSRGLESGDLVV